MARLSTRALLRSGRLSRLGLTTGQSLVLVVLVDHADASGLSFPAQRTIALETGMQRSSVQKALGGLVERGVIELAAPGGPKMSDTYRISTEVGLRAAG